MSAPAQPAWLDLFPDKDFEFRFSVRPGDAEQFLGPTEDHEQIIAARQAALDGAANQHQFNHPEAADALAECCKLAAITEPSCRALALKWEPDFLILLPSENRRFIFRAGAVCFPSSWRPEEKIGHPVYAIHAPVPTLNETLGAQIDKFLANLKPGQSWERSNWGLAASPALNQHPAQNTPVLDPPFAADQAWVRIEDQLLHHLPHSGALLFGIRLVNVSLAEIKQFPAAQAGLHRAIATMPDEIADYKNVTQSREHLLGLLKN